MRSLHISTLKLNIFNIFKHPYLILRLEIQLWLQRIRSCFRNVKKVKNNVLLYYKHTSLQQLLHFTYSWHKIKFFIDHILSIALVYRILYCMSVTFLYHFRVVIYIAHERYWNILKDILKWSRASGF